MDLLVLLHTRTYKKGYFKFCERKVMIISLSGRVWFVLEQMFQGVVTSIIQSRLPCKGCCRDQRECGVAAGKLLRQRVCKNL